MEGGELPGLVALDEPTRGMDRARKRELDELIEGLAGRGAGVVVATHDVEFAAAFAERVVLLGDGVVIADGPAAEVLSGGWYFATEVARVLDLPGVVTPEQGAAALLAGGRRMSWQLASFLILGAVLIGGFAWYERSRPSSQVVALVAALAALAVAGRVAFAALPNVVATTDIVIFAGFALGPAPGFAVGALAGLVSNFWLGQGPWTPWQMAGWGMCGVLGAGLALARPRANRLTLAAVCALAGVAYGALLNFSLMATYGGELSWSDSSRWSRARFRSTPRTRSATPASRSSPARRWCGCWPASASASSGAPRPSPRSSCSPSPWRASRRPAPAPPTSAPSAPPSGSPGSRTPTAAGALRRATTPRSNRPTGRCSGSRPPAAARSTVKRGGHSPVDYLRGHVGELKSPGALARTILALQGAKVDPRSFGGRNLVAALLKRRRGNGSFEGWPGSTAFAVIALRGAGATGASTARSPGWPRRRTTTAAGATPPARRAPPTARPP